MLFFAEEADRVLCFRTLLDIGGGGLVRPARASCPAD